MMNREDKQPLVSVIIPIYNAEPYLDTCIHALMAQTYTHIEILLVDDGSYDRSGVMCDEYAQKDKRIHVLHLQNGGVSRARNKALEMMNGDWVCFADADDEVTPYYVQHFVDAIEEDIDVIISEAIFVHENGKRERLSYKSYGTLPLTEIFSANELSAHGYAWAKCYRAWPLHSATYGPTLRFPEEIKFSEDLLFVMQYLAVSPQAKYIPYADYIYYLRSGSASSRIFPFEVEQRCFYQYIEQMKILSALAEMDLMQISSSASILAMLFARVRNCMYLRGELTRTKRLKFYRSITPEVKTSILNHLQTSNMLVRIGYKLFMVSEHWYLLDAYFSVIMKMKQLLSKKN